MLRVTVEIVPFGIEENKAKIFDIEISNKFTSKDNIADYLVIAKDIQDKNEIMFFVNKFDRKNGAWSLLEKVFDDISTKFKFRR